VETLKTDFHPPEASAKMSRSSDSCVLMYTGCHAIPAGMEMELMTPPVQSEVAKKLAEPVWARFTASPLPNAAGLPLPLDIPMDMAWH
jgi:hypothetical protein